jgi:hypothetical protein
VDIPLLFDTYFHELIYFVGDAFALYLHATSVFKSGNGVFLLKLCCSSSLKYFFWGGYYSKKSWNRNTPAKYLSDQELFAPLNWMFNCTLKKISSLLYCKDCVSLYSIFKRSAILLNPTPVEGPSFGPMRILL